MENGKNVLIQEAPEMLSLEKQASLAGFITETLIKGCSNEQVDYWISHKKELKKNLTQVFSLLVDEYADVREDWQKFYKNFLNWDMDFSGVIIPEKPTTGGWRLIFIAKGLTHNQVYNAWTFKKGKYYEDIDANTPTNTRTATANYAKWVQDGAEPDTDFLGKSTKDADPKMKIGVTLLERMILEAKYFSETGKNLDKKGLTFCSGSRSSGGGVPYVFFFDDRVYVGWSDVDNSCSDYGIRRAV